MAQPNLSEDVIGTNSAAGVERPWKKLCNEQYTEFSLPSTGFEPIISSLVVTQTSGDHGLSPDLLYDVRLFGWTVVHSCRVCAIHQWSDKFLLYAALAGLVVLIDEFPERVPQLCGLEPAHDHYGDNCEAWIENKHEEADTRPIAGNHIAQRRLERE
jgi:hypothetical protein